MRMQEMEEYVRTVLETLEKEVKDCLLRKDKQWEEKLEQRCPAVLCVTHAAITSPEALNLSTAQPNTSSSGSDNGKPPSTEPETRTIYSRLPFSKEELLEAQADDTTILQLKASCTSLTSKQPRLQEHHQTSLYATRHSWSTSAPTIMPLPSSILRKASRKGKDSFEGYGSHLVAIHPEGRLAVCG